MGRGVILSKNKRQPSSKPYYIIPENPKYPWTITGGTRVDSGAWGGSDYYYNLSGFSVGYNVDGGRTYHWSTFTSTIDIHGQKTATLRLTNGSYGCTPSGYQYYSITMTFGDSEHSTARTFWCEAPSWEGKSIDFPEFSLVVDLTGLRGKVTCTISTYGYAIHSGSMRFGIRDLYIE